MTLSELTWRRAADAYTAGYSWALTAPTVPAPYLYNATVVDVVDGDTLNVIVDWGFHRYEGSATHPQPIRLLGCNAAEKATDGGKAAKANLIALLPAGTALVLATANPDKYAPRWDAAVTYLQNSQPVDLVAYLIAQQWAAPWDGNGKAPVPPWPRTLTPPTTALGQDRKPQ